MTYNELKIILQMRYTLDNFKCLLDDVFPQIIQYFEHPQQLFQEQDKVVKGFQFGRITLSDGRYIALFDVQVNDSVNITKNRKGLRDIAIRYIDNDIVHGALVIFHTASKPDFRLSFMARQSEFSEEGDFVTTQTAPKRYTFILGENESCTTAAKRLAELKEKVSKGGLDAITEAFSVEKLNKEFFNGYKDHYMKFWKYLNAQPEYRSLLVDNDQTIQEKAEKPIRDFAKKLLGRIVFLYFLQKKGWMGVPNDQQGWKNGDPNFIKNFFQNFDNKSLFYSLGLVRLFFETLNNERTNHIFELTGTKIPYLNGGLFDNDLPETNHFNFPEEYFELLFAFFDQYNFTIDENDPDDANIGIDPEMLGHIFENLLEENKDRGTFYTPKAIVQYMCQESLIQYLQTHLGDETKEELANFIRLSERGPAKGFIVQNARKIEDLLDNVKICDPAIGSGAFPMGMLQEIFKAKMTLDLTLDPAETKRHIIQHAIYGVDLERGAVDIARLRFWLALVVDEDTPSPLPNLDYKIMQGNSLLESFEGIPLANLQHTKKTITLIEGGQQLDMFGNVIAQQTRMEFLDEQQQNLDDLIDAYFGANSQHKANIKSQINSIVHEHLHYNVDLKLAEIQTKIAGLEHEISLININENDPKAKREKKGKVLATKQKALENQQHEALRLENALLTLDRIQETNERPYFLWHLFFKDVFEQGGFDIVIGNPPYVQLQNDGGYLAKLYEKEGFESFERTGDIYSLFYEQGYKCLKFNGTLCYITSNKWMRAGYGESLRNFFALKTNPLILIDFAGQKIFENATVDTNILLFSKNSNAKQTQACIIKDKLFTISEYLNTNKVLTQFTTSDSWVILSPIEQGIKEKIERIGTPLKDWDVNIYRGILTGFNEAFIISGDKKDALIATDPKSAEIIRPILRGRDIKRYGYEFADLWLITTFPSLKVDIENYPAVKEHLMSFGYDRLKQTGDLNARKKTNNKWFEIQDSIGYWEDFYKPKILWAETMRVHRNTHELFPRFSIELTENYYTDKTCFFATGQNLKTIIAILNSKLGFYLCSQYVSILDDGGYLMQKMYLEKIPIAMPNDGIRIELENIIDKVLNENLSKTLDKKYEELLNRMTYEIYELTPKEIEFIENQ